MMRSALAVRTYTSSQIKPLLDGQNHYKFLPQTVPSYAATEYFNSLASSADFRDFAYKEATLNPTNPRDRAAEWELDVVNRFRQHPELTELVGERDGEFGKSLFLAQPLQIKDPACLACHSTVSAAPQTMIELYGTANGFGWKPNEIVGAQVVSVPQSVAIQRADAIVTKILYLLAGLFVVLFIALNVMLSALVIRPMKRLGIIADQVSLGRMDAPEFPATGADEMAVLGQSFNRMRRSLVEAIEMLEK
jgi:protein-histidine pros-kinase